jgi:hypothetical protein
MGHAAAIDVSFRRDHDVLAHRMQQLAAERTPIRRGLLLARAQRPPAGPGSLIRRRGSRIMLAISPDPQLPRPLHNGFRAMRSGDEVTAWVTWDAPFRPRL